MVFKVVADCLTGCAAGSGAALAPPCRSVVRARNSSAHGAGGGRSCNSGGGRKERAGLGAVGGGPDGFREGMANG